MLYVFVHSGRAKHFWPKGTEGTPILTKKYMKKMRSIHSEHFWSQRCVKNANKWKTRFLREFWLYLQNGKVNFYDFLAQNIFHHKQKNGKEKFSKFSSILEKKSTLQKLKLLKNPSFYFFEIQNLRSQSPKSSGPQSSASSLDLFGQGKQFGEIFEVSLRLEGLNQKILLRKKVLELNFMVL